MKKAYAFNKVIKTGKAAAIGLTATDLFTDTAVDASGATFSEVVQQQINTGIASLVSAQNLDDQEISALELSVANANSNISTIQSQVSTANTNIATANTNIGTLQTQMTTANTNIATANTNIGTLQTQMTTANTNISTNQSDITSLKTRATTLETKATATDASFNTVATKQAVYDASFIAIATKQAVYDASFIAIATKQTVYDASFSAVATKQTVYDASFSAITAKQTVYDASFGAITAKQTVYDASFSAVATKQTVYDASFGAITAKQAVYDASFGAVATKQATYDASFIAMNNDYISLSQRTATSEGKINAIETKNTAQDVSFNAINTRLTTIDSSLNFLTTKTSAHDLSFNAVNTRFATVDSSFSAITNDYISLAQQMATANGKITAIETKNTAQDASFNAIATKHSAYDTHFATVDASLNAMGGSSISLDASNIWTQPQSYADGVQATTDNQLMSRGSTSYLIDTEINNQVLTYFSQTSCYGGNSAICFQDPSSQPSPSYPWCLSVPYMGINTTNRVDIQNYPIFTGYINFPKTVNTTTTLLDRSCSIRFRLEIYYASAVPDLNYVTINSNSTNNHTAWSATERTMRKIPHLPGEYGRVIIDNTLGVAIQGNTSASGLFLNVRSLFGNACVNNSNTDAWSHRPSGAYFTNTSTTMAFYPIAFAQVNEGKVQVTVNVPKKTNDPSSFVWASSYSFRLDIIQSMPCTPTTNLLYGNINYDNTTMTTPTGGAYFSLS